MAPAIALFVWSATNRFLRLLLCFIVNLCGTDMFLLISSVVRFVYFDFLCNSSLFVKVFSIYDWLPYQCFFLCNQQSGVSEVIYFVEKRLKNSDTAYVASHKLLTLAGVKVSSAYCRNFSLEHNLLPILISYLSPWDISFSFLVENNLL